MNPHLRNDGHNGARYYVHDDATAFNTKAWQTGISL